jgi:HNH endonuclease
MANHFGMRVQAGEAPSEKYPDFLLRSGGVFRRSFQWVNPSGKTRHGSRYFTEQPCSVCGGLHLVDATNLKKQKKFACSEVCRLAVKSIPEGSRRKKRGPIGDSHVMVRASNHPSATVTGMVPEHRLVVEELLGRLLDPSELIHHINCIKSDNHPENLVLCNGIAEHNIAHASLNKCVAELLSCGVLWFDRDSMSYKVLPLVNGGAA